MSTFVNSWLALSVLRKAEALKTRRINFNSACMLTWGKLDYITRIGAWLPSVMDILL